MTNWQLSKSIDAIIFDCDGTLSQLEGIDELARINGVDEQVVAMTQDAMSNSGMNPDLFAKRLARVKPTRIQLQQLANSYYQHCVDDVLQVIQILQSLKKSIYVVSAGNNPAVKLFAEKLGIAAEHVYAVDLLFDDQGEYRGFDHRSPMTSRDGKRQVVAELSKQHDAILHVGDGLNDYVAHDMVARFVGYGGAFYREKVAACAAFYIRCASMLPLLPLTLTQAEAEALTAEAKAAYLSGVSLIDTNQVQIHTGE